MDWVIFMRQEEAITYTLEVGEVFFSVYARIWITYATEDTQTLIKCLIEMQAGWRKAHIWSDPLVFVCIEFIGDKIG